MLSIIIIVVFIFSLVSFILRYLNKVGNKKISDDEISINEDNMATWNIFEEIKRTIEQTNSRLCL